MSFLQAKWGDMGDIMATETDNRDNQFIQEFMEFYNEFVRSSSDAISKLADVQKNYPEKYELLRNLHNNPLDMVEDIEQLGEKQKDALLMVILKASRLGQRTKNVIQTTVEEKEDLIEDLDGFGEFVEEKIEETFKGDD